MLERKKRILEVKNLPILANSKTGIWTHGRQAAKLMYWALKYSPYSSSLDSGWPSRKTFLSYHSFLTALILVGILDEMLQVTPHKDLAERVPLTIIWVILFHLFGQATCSRVLKIMFSCVYTALQCDLLSHPSRGGVCFSTRSLWIDPGACFD